MSLARNDAATSHASGAGDSDRGGAWQSRPQLDSLDLIPAIWREWPLMALVGAPIIAAAIGLALMQEKKYEAGASLVVNIGQEYVFDPQVGDAGRGALPDAEQVVQAEVEILSARALTERMLDRFGIETLYPKLGDALLRAGDDAAKRAEIRSAAVKAFRQNFGASATPKSQVIRTGYSGHDPQLAADVLNALIDEYLDYRKQVLIRPEDAAFGDQRQLFENDLQRADDDLAQFLRRNRINDFDAERAATAALLQRLEDDLLSAQASVAQLETQYAALTARIDQLAPEVNIEVESDAENQLLQLRIDRAELAARFKPGAGPLAEIDRQIAEMEQTVRNGRAVGITRRGPNPVYQDLQTQQLTLEGDLAAAQARAAALATQRDALGERLATMTRLAPDYEALLRTRRALAASAENFATREQEQRAIADLAALGARNIAVVEPALAPVEGNSWRAEIGLGGLAFALFTAFMAGLARALTRETFASVRAAGANLGLTPLGTLRVAPRR